MRPHLASVVIGASLFATPMERAWGEEAIKAALDVQISDAASVCVSPEEVIERVVARLGYDPFFENASLKVTVTIDERDGAFVALIETLAANKPR